MQSSRASARVCHAAHDRPRPHCAASMRPWSTSRSPTRTGSSSRPPAAFAEAEILPHIREWDEKGEVHREVFAKMAEQGFLGAPIPEAYGGAGMDYISFAILCEELERADTAFRVVQSVHVGLNSLALLQWGTEEQRQRWLVPAGEGREARDVRADRARGRHRRRQPRRRRRAGTATPTASTARRSGSASPTSPTTSSSSRSSTARKKHKGVTAFLLERGMPGLTTGTLHGKLGIRAGNTGLINLDDVLVPGRPPDRRGGRGLPDRDERDRPGPLHGRRGRGRARPGLPRRERQVRARAADVRPGDRRSTSSSSR